VSGRYGSSFQISCGSTQHVIHRDGNRHIDELWWDGDWHHNDLTTATNAPVPAFNVGAYVFEGQKTQHVIYRGWDDHLHELWWDGEQHYNHLTVAAGAPSAK
jgi:hypothetical protein